MIRTIEQRKATWRDFYVADGKRKFICRVVPPDDAPARPLPYPELKEQRIDWAWDQYQRMAARVEWLPDDTIPFLNPYTGTEIFAAAFGCEVSRPNDDMPFALPMVTTAAEADKLKVPDLDCEPMAILFEIADELRRRAGDDALLALPDIQSPMDITALVWDKNYLFCAMVDEAKAVHALAAKAMELLAKFLDEWFRRYGREFIAHYPSYYMPWGLTLSEDEIGSVSPEMFQEFFLPTLVALSERYDGIGIHCCADSRHQWDGFRKIPKLRLMNLGGTRTADEIREAYELFSPDTAHWHYAWNPGEPLWEHLAEYPPGTRAVLNFGPPNREKAIEAAEKMAAAREKVE